MEPKSKIAAGIAELDEGLETLLGQIRAVDREGVAVAERIHDQCHEAMQRFGQLWKEFEENGSWKVQINEAVALEKSLADRLGERYELLNIVSSIVEEAKAWEAEQKLVISEKKNGTGKNLYSNEVARAAALLQTKAKDSDWAEIQDRIQDVELQILVFDIETKKMEAEVKGKWAFVRMIEARLRSMSFR